MLFWQMVGVVELLVIFRYVFGHLRHPPEVFRRFNCKHEAKHEEKHGPTKREPETVLKSKAS